MREWTPGCDLEGQEFSPKYCLPYAYLAGIQKSGTSDLYRQLKKHKHIFASVKEPSYWNKLFTGSIEIISVLNLFYNNAQTQFNAETYAQRYMVAYYLGDALSIPSSVCILIRQIRESNHHLTISQETNN